MTAQKAEFLAGEADAWFRRNEQHLRSDGGSRDLVASSICAQLRADRPKVLEIGCGRGDNLAALANRIEIAPYGLEPSQNAVQAGLATYPGLDLRRGTADALPFDDNSFDVVWYGFCLYLVDRDLIGRCVAEADRVLRNGGLLCVVDFDPDAPCRRSYHHRAGLWSYKMDYSLLFLANPVYRLVEKRSLSHAFNEWHPDPQERVGMWLCRKDAEHAYRVV